MAFSRANVLTTREFCFGARRLGQIVAVPSGRLDKVSVYLEPVITNPLIAENVNVVVQAFNLDMFGNPAGAALATDSILLSDITIPGFQNFRLQAFVPTIIAIVVSAPNGDQDNYVGWRYVTASSGGQEVLISPDNGATWTQDPTRIFAYKTFTMIANAVDPVEQSAIIQAGHLLTFTDTGPEFAMGILDRTAVTGDTLAINFGDFVVTLVVDQSGSMTWNDHEGLRFEFLKDFIADIQASLPSTSNVSYSLIKFRGRRIGSMTIQVQGSSSSGLHLDGVRIVRNVSHPPANINDGIVVSEGLVQQFIDQGLSPGTTYYYGAFAFNNLGGAHFAPSEVDFATVTTPVLPPLSVAGVFSSAIVTDNAGATLPSTSPDLGYRRVELRWTNPQGFDYDQITIVRRDDHFSNSPIDPGATIIYQGVPTVSQPIIDTFGGTYKFSNGATYFYSIFTQNSTGIKCALPNARNTSVSILVAPRPWEQIEPPGNVPPVGFPVVLPLSPTISSLIESNGEIQLNWLPADSITVRYKLYYDAGSFPIPIDDKGQNYTGQLLYDGSGTTFIHRFIQNEQPAFYVLIAMDRVENASLPTKPMVGTRPPRPTASAQLFLAPDPVTNFEATTVNATTILLSWTNPQPPPLGTQKFFFGDAVNVVANVAFLDQGNSQSFLSLEFDILQRSLKPIGNNDISSIDSSQVINAAHVSSISSDTIVASVSITPSLAIQNQLNSASITMRAALRVRDNLTNNVIAEVKTQQITINFDNPFILDIKNDPPQTINRRTWGPDPNAVPGSTCTDFLYQVASLPGIYINSGKPFFAVIEAQFREAALGAPLNVAVELLDAATGKPTEIVKVTAINSTGQFQTSDVSDEVLDNTGRPTGAVIDRSVLPLTLPPSDVPGDFVLQVTATFKGYVRTTSLTVHYEPILNVDLNLFPFTPDNVDRAEQSAFVYLAPFDADQADKIPVADFTVTSWSIRPLCVGAPQRFLYSEDNVPGLGVLAFTHGGLAQKIFWGPGEDVSDDQSYEVSVVVKANGQVGKGFGEVTLSPTQLTSVNKIFLRNVNTFYDDTIFADGTATSTWEVIARPEDDAGDSTSGQAFRNAIVNKGGQVPSLDDGRIVTMNIKLMNNSADATTPAQVAAAIDNIRIKTNLTGPNGKAGSAKAMIAGGKALFSISCNAKVPPPPTTDTGFSQADITENLYYQVYGINFDRPKVGMYLVLTVFIPVEINGKLTAFYGGGSDLVLSTPPCFLELKEPLNLT